MSHSVSLVDLGFMDARAKMLDVAAFLDRVQRHDQAVDFRVEAIKQALPLLLSPDDNRVEKILLLLSDPTSQPIPEAHTKGACGAWPGPENS